jgi:diaminopimelate decarboxylase
MATLAMDDLLYLQPPLLTAAEPGRVVTANAGMTMTAVALIGLAYRVSKKRFIFAWDFLAIVTVYLYAVTVL